ncbi:ABC transporter ATP-binding protein [Streptomyces sp. NPDC059639]|uniref:ABC transporter ATP-binding protein n=1 Tax=Streptomyces sp. NPDC059639 TaxID=3346891 RepID=UPI0036A1B630
MTTPLLELRGVTRHFKVGTGLSRRALHAVDDVDLTVGEREILALVGESGSGKSTLARLVAQVHRPTRGEIRYQGRPLTEQRGRRAKLAYRGAVPMVFQDPFSALNPAYRVSHGILRGITLHQPQLGRAERQSEAERVTEAVGLAPDVLDRFPHELSGGQRQRIGFAQALAHRPRLILADEPVSMLDVSIRIGLLNVMADLRETENVSILYITHDIASARYLSDRIAVMYGGHIVETGPTEEVLAHPRHPYTDLLLSAVPDPRAPLDVDAATAKSDPPVVIDPTPGCRFRARCPLATAVCDRITPRLEPVATSHTAACHVTAPGTPGTPGAPEALGADA